MLQSYCFQYGAASLVLQEDVYQSLQLFAAICKGRGFIQELEGKEKFSLEDKIFLRTMNFTPQPLGAANVHKAMKR